MKFNLQGGKLIYKNNYIINSYKTVDYNFVSNLLQVWISFKPYFCLSVIKLITYPNILETLTFVKESFHKVNFSVTTAYALRNKNSFTNPKDFKS